MLGNAVPTQISNKQQHVQTQSTYTRHCVGPGALAQSDPVHNVLAQTSLVQDLLVQFSFLK